MAFSTHDIVSDSPTNNFAALNFITASSQDNLINYTEGNLAFTHSASSGNAAYMNVESTFGMSTGKWYWEYTNLSNQGVGISLVMSEENAHLPSIHMNYYYDGTISGNGATLPSSGATFTSSDIIGVAFNADSGILSFYKNNSLQGTVTNIPANNTYVARTAAYTGSVSGSANFNFGQDPTFGGNKSPSTTYTDANGIGAFYYQPPTGALALCTANLPDFTPTVTGDVPADYFKAVIWTGDNIYPRSISTDFAPDLIWTKARTLLPTSNVNSDHLLMDSVRGDGNLKWISSSQTNAEGTYSGNADADLTSSGFTIQSITGTNALNDNNAKFVAWCWKAGGVPTADNTATSGAMNANGSAATSSNSSVSINGVLQSNYTPAGSPTIYPKRMSINTDAGFSIVKYYGNNATNSNQSIPSGLSSLDFVIIKDLDDPEYWFVYHKSLSTNHNLYLQLPNAQTNVSTSGGGGIKNPLTDGNIVPLLGNINTTNINDTHNFIAYCWHSVEGYSKFGSYEGSTALPFVYCGFRPALVICKCTSDTTTTHTSWAMYDNARDSSNVMNKVLYANKSIQEGYRGNGSTAATDIYIDFLSNGFKVRSTKEEINDDGETYIFMAFAEQPFKFSNAR
jgi:hypothetical protein